MANSLTGSEIIPVIRNNHTVAIRTDDINSITYSLDIPVESGFNPIYPLNDSLASAQRSVIYFPTGFNVGGLGTAYKYVKVWVNDNVNVLKVSASNNFVNWTFIGDVTGVHGGNHPCIIEVPSGFRLFYLDAAMTYNVHDLRTATSTDFLNFANDHSLENDPTNPIVTGAGTGWNRGSYGISSAFYNPDATNTGSDPRNYSYLAYYDVTDGAFEAIALCYSTDGTTFKLYGNAPVVTHSSEVWGAVTPWDSSYVTWAQVLKISENRYLMFYCGGRRTVLEGVGAAYSFDGLLWYKLSINAPVISPQKGTWRDSIASFPALIMDGLDDFEGAGQSAIIKLMITGGDATTWSYSNGVYRIPTLKLSSDFILYRTLYQLSELDFWSQKKAISNVDMNSMKLTNLLAPHDDQDSATKGYVDGKAFGSITDTNFSLDTDAFGRKRLLFKVDNNFLKLGEFTADGDPDNKYSDGIVAVGANSQGIFDQTNYCYARIKPTRFGLFDTIAGKQLYIFRVDPVDFYLKNDSGTKTFDFTRSNGNLTVSGRLLHGEMFGTVRPVTPANGQQFFDSTLGRPIWYNGAAWVDALGGLV